MLKNEITMLSDAVMLRNTLQFYYESAVKSSCLLLFTIEKSFDSLFSVNKRDVRVSYEI